MAACLQNGNIDSGWQVGGNETMATVGDPNWNNPFPMANVYAAQYVMNITRSIADFSQVPGTTDDHLMPGEYMARNFMLAATLDAVPQDTAPTSFVANPNRNASLQSYILTNNGQYNVGAYGTAGPGVVPTRLSIAISDNNMYSDHKKQDYVDVLGGTLIHAQPLNTRNAIMGDFSGTGARNFNQIPQMMVAFGNPSGLANKGAVCVEIIGDFTGDGNFKADDIRYFADGLAIDPATGNLNRATGFAMVDLNWTAALAAGRDPNYNIAGNFFKTTLPSTLGRPYLANSGWSRADITGAAGKVPTPGAFAGASDGKIDNKDIDYVNYVLRGGIKAKALGQTLAANPAVRGNVWDFADANQAPFMDLSCDMNGDLKVDSTDVDYIVQTVLATQYGDVNFDGKVDFTDFAILAANFGNAGGWANGDTNGDGFVDASDLILMQQNWLFGY